MNARERRKAYRAGERLVGKKVLLKTPRGFRQRATVEASSPAGRVLVTAPYDYGRRADRAWIPLSNIRTLPRCWP